MLSKLFCRLLQTFGRGECVLVMGLALLSLLLGAHPAHAAQLSLTWTDTSSNEDGFHVQRKTGTAGTFATIATPAAGTTGYVDGTVTAGTTYCYRVSAFNSAGDSAYSNEACAAAAAPILYTLTASKAGAGSGTVASSPAGLDCGSTCSASFTSGASVALSATANSGSTFTGWSGCTTVVGASCTVVVDAAKSVTATFALSTPTTYTLGVTKTGTGSGTVTSSPNGINCGSTCSSLFNSGTTVILYAVAATGSHFMGWSGACTGTGDCTVAMSAAKNVTATFTQNTYALTVSKTGTGSGTVTSSPSGVTCGSTCGASYNYNTSVTLTATPATGSTFTGWSGGGCSGTGTCTVTMTQAQTVAATFNVNTPTAYAITVVKSGAGSGIVASNPAGVNCGATCAANFATGTIVTLQALPDAGSTFTGWSGACTGAGGCTITADATKNVTATFALAAPTTYALTVTKSGAGTGIVASNPAGVNCGSICSAYFSAGATITLEALPNAGSTFTGWGGACTGVSSCTVTMSQARSVTATFGLQAAALTVTKTGPGNGMVTSVPTGIACYSTCSASFPVGTVVSLTATAEPGTSFNGWSGACVGNGACQVTLNQSKSVTAKFNRKRK